MICRLTCKSLRLTYIARGSSLLRENQCRLNVVAVSGSTNEKAGGVAVVGRQSPGQFAKTRVAQPGGGYLVGQPLHAVVVVSGQSAHGEGPDRIKVAVLGETLKQCVALMIIGGVEKISEVPKR